MPDMDKGRRLMTEMVLNAGKYFNTGELRAVGVEIQEVDNTKSRKKTVCFRGEDGKKYHHSFHYGDLGVGGKEMVPKGRSAVLSMQKERKSDSC
jgi:hypothetical protein